MRILPDAAHPAIGAKCRMRLWFYNGIGDASN
ncbi:hypothetical protein Asd1617_02886 [Shigella dysenteriae 1617]|uniref:Uncharacterized protein n=1 Tax=Shigella dysenteriae 1617 TaxID=754093 RepID=A0A0A6ZUA1_SHIDY|nr:hypothetical protein Asd1617_02886 [Shigella dysenteriae 1617]